jgi:hypothetical protein
LSAAFTTTPTLEEQLTALHRMLDDARMLRSSDIPSVAASMTKVIATVTQILRTVEPATFSDRALPWE